MKKKVENDSGEEHEYDVDNPDAVEEENSNASSEKTGGRRSSGRLRATPKKKTKYASSDEDGEEELDDEDADEDFDEEEFEAKSRKKPGPRSARGKAAPKKKSKPKSEEEDEDEEDEDEEDEDEEEDDEEDSNDNEPMNPDNKDYVSGAFLVSKSDLADKDNDPPLWRIDGKALLQKYIPFKDDEGKTLYRNTYTYSGWSINNKNNYYPASIQFKQQSQKEHVVEFQRDLLPKEEENDD